MILMNISGVSDFS